MADASLELYLARTWRELVVDAAGAGAIVQAIGVADGAEPTDEEWYAPFVVHFLREPSRGTLLATARLQVSCFSRPAFQRSDKSTDRPWAMAARIRSQLGTRLVPVLDYGDTGSVPVGYLSLTEADQTYLPEKDGAHGVAVVYRAHVNS